MGNRRSNSIATYVRVFAKAGFSLLVQPGTNAQMKIRCCSYELKLKIERRARTAVDACKMLKLHCPALLLQILLLAAYPLELPFCFDKI
jgi:hypothetical protein